MHDVIVIGAGASGLNAARSLAEGGLDVVVLEKKNEVGKNVICTGIVGKEAFREFELAKDSILTEIKKIKLVSPYAGSLSYEHAHPFAYVVDREKFDKHLMHKARVKGAEIKLENKVVDISVNKNSVEVLAKREGKYDEKYSAQIALVATGVNYKLHKQLGMGYPKDFLNGVQAELKIERVDCPSVFVGRAVAPGGFAWVVPVKGEIVRIGLITDKDPKVHFEHLMEKLYPDRMRCLDKNLIKFKPIAQGLVSKTYGDRILSVGEAAGQVKTTTGGGIYFGLLCSEIASQIVSKRFKEGNFTANALAEYEKLWKRSLRKEILIGYYTRRILGKLSDIQTETIFQIAKNDGVIPLVKEKGDFDWHSDLLFALFKRFPLLKILKSKEVE